MSNKITYEYAVMMIWNSLRHNHYLILNQWKFRFSNITLPRLESIKFLLFIYLHSFFKLFCIIQLLKFHNQIRQNFMYKNNGVQIHRLWMQTCHSARTKFLNIIINIFEHKISHYLILKFRHFNNSKEFARKNDEKRIIIKIYVFEQ